MELAPPELETAPVDEEQLDAPRPPTWHHTTRRMRALVVLVATVMLLGGTLRVPYYSLGPGPATDVATILRIEGAKSYRSSGSLLLTTVMVSGRTITMFEYLWTLVDDDLEAVPQRFILPPGITDEAQQAENLRAMESSKLQAELAAFLALGLQVDRLAAARVLGVNQGSASDGVLERDDLIVAIDGVPTPTAQAVVEAIRARRPGLGVTLRIRRGGKARSLPVTLDDRGDGTGSMGASVIDAYRFPVSVKIDTQRIGGPSGGLVFALSVMEALTAEDLTRGRKIAVTGTIGFQDGVATVGPIGGMEEKVRGAIAAGAEIFIVPAADGPRALAVAPKELRVIPVATLDDALAALRAE